MVKRFLAGLGIVLMFFNGIGVVAVLLSLPTFFRSGDNPLAINLLVFIMLLAVFTGLFALGCKLKSMGGPAQTKQSTAAAPAPMYEPRHRPTEPPAQKTASQTPNPPAPEPVSMNKEPSGLQPQPTVREIIGLPEEVDIIRCPFDDQLKEIGPDGLDNESHVAQWLRPRENADAASVIRALAEYLKKIETRAAALKNGHFLEYWSIMKNGNDLYVLLVDSMRWLEGVPADLLALCRENEKKTICVAMLNHQGMYDLVTGTEYMLRYQEWPGSADDAATYGQWWLEESRPAAKAADVPEPAAEREEPMRITGNSEDISLDELTALILSDCRKLGMDEKEIASIKKYTLVKTSKTDTREGFHFTYEPETRSYWLSDFKKGKASGGIEDTSSLNFRFKFVRNFIFHNPPKIPENKEKWETFLQQTRDSFSATADYQAAVQQCLWQIPGFASPAPYKPCLSWMGFAVPIGSEQVKASNQDELYRLGYFRWWPLTHYKGEPYMLVNENDLEQWESWNRREAKLYRADKGFFHVPMDELEDVLDARSEIRLQNGEDWFPVTSHVWRTGQEMGCMIADPEYKLPLHTNTPTFKRIFGAIVQIDLNQAEEVRLRLGTPVIDLLKTTPQSLQNEVEAYHRTEARKGAIRWNGTMVSTVLDQILDSSVQELRASGYGVISLIAKFGNELYIPQPVQGKIKLWRDGKALHTVSPDETVELYAAQFDVQVQGEWFLCFGVSKAEPTEGSFDCVVDDPEFKLPSLHSQHSNYMWGSGVEINSSQIEAVRLWRSKSLTDLLARTEPRYEK